MTADYDVVVIGGGAAGLAAARSAVRAGVHTMLVTDGPPGGDCTFTGCVPSKTLIEAAGQGLPFDKAMARVREAVARIAATEDEQALRTEGIDVLRGRARLGAPNQIEVDRQVLGARRIVIATGAKPVLPAVPGLDSVESLTTDTIFGLTVPPGSLAVLGGGAVGCELAQAFARLGVRVTLVEATDRLLPDHDPEVSTLLAEVLTADGVSVHTGAPAESVQGDSHAATLRAGSATVTAARLLVAAGRIPETGGLGLDVAGVATDNRGFITVDKHLETTAAGVYAVGDVTGLFGHTHAAYAMGRVAIGAALRRARRPTFSTRAIPRVVFTDPEIATVGLAEHQVADRRARVAYLPMAEVDRAIAAESTSGFVKLIAGPRAVLGNIGGGRLLGATIVADRAGELINEAALAMTAGMFTGRLAQTAHAYPTWSIALQQAAAQFTDRTIGCS
ncbi:MAG: dihydrolipoyl dehydrogenase family protein [Thermocrispum sp.]